MRVQGGFIGLFWFVETELVIPTVLGTGQLLDQKHNRIVEDPQHPQAIHTYRMKGTRVVNRVTNRKLCGIDKWRLESSSQRLPRGQGDQTVKS